jgi:hypothetical protein
VLEGSFVNIKSIAIRDILREVLKGITYISLRENKPSVSTLLRVVLPATYNILYRSIRISYSPIYCQECQGAPRAWRPQLKSWLLRQSLNNQRSVSEHQWLLRTTVITHVLHIRIAYKTHIEYIEALYYPPGIVVLIILNAPLQAVRYRLREVYAQIAHYEERDKEQRLLRK